MTDQTMRASSAPQFTIGNVLGTSFTVLFRNIVPFAVIAALISIPSILISRFYVMDPLAMQEALRQGAISPGDVAGSFLISTLVIMLTSSLISAALVYGTYQDLRGQRASIGDVISRGLSVIIPVLLAAVAYAILVGIGFMLLFIPGIILGLMLWVYIPAIIVERKGVGAAFSRSRELTKGRRWSIFGLLIVIGILVLVVSWIAGFVSALIFGSGGAFWAGQIAQIAIAMFSAVTVAVGYYYLRADKEGISLEEIAKVFD